jgi:hypothetical protein
MANRSTIETTSHTSTEQLTMLKEEQITSEQISSEDIHTEHVLSQPQSVDTASYGRKYISGNLIDKIIC